MIDKMEHDLVKIIGVYEDGSTQEYERGALVSLKREEDSTCATLQLAKCRPSELMQIRDLVNDMFIHDTYYLYAVMNKNNILSLRRILPANVSATSEDTQGNTMTYNVTIGQETISVNNLLVSP